MPEPPDPAYQQILKGVPAADFSGDELLYPPRNPRAHRLYGLSPVEQIALTVNIALRRDAATLDYYRAGSTPDAFATLPKEWTSDQIRSFQDYFDALMSGNSPRRRMIKFMPADFRLIEARQPPLKDLYDEWLARVICYAFSVPATPFVSQVNRATGETMRLQATQEGLVPLKSWIKNALDRAIQDCMNEPDLEFAWVGDDAVDPLQQAQTLNILVSAGIKTREEARAELGLGAEGGTPKGPSPGAPVDLGKFNPYHDPHNGQFTTAEGAGAAAHLVANSGSPNKYSVSLDEEEKKKDGHTLKDHVGKTKHQLIDLIQSTRRDIPTAGGTLISIRKAQGSFTSKEAANDLVNRVLQNHKAEVDLVSSGQWDRQWLEDRIGSPTGIEAVFMPDLNIIVRSTYNVGVDIVHDPTSLNGYRVKTAYPKNDKNSYPFDGD